MSNELEQDEFRTDYVDAVVGAVSREIVAELGIPLESIKGDSRTTEIVIARQTLIGLLFTFGLKTPEIARYFDKRHSTITYNLQRVGLYKEGAKHVKPSPYLDQINPMIQKIATKLSYLHMGQSDWPDDRGITLEAAIILIRQLLSDVNFNQVRVVYPVISYIRSLFRRTSTSILFDRYLIGLSFLALNAPIREIVNDILLRVEDRNYEQIIRTAAERYNVPFTPIESTSPVETENEEEYL